MLFSSFGFQKITSSRLHYTDTCNYLSTTYTQLQSRYSPTSYSYACVKKFKTLGNLEINSRFFIQETIKAKNKKLFDLDFKSRLETALISSETLRL